MQTGGYLAEEHWRALSLTLPHGNSRPGEGEGVVLPLVPYDTQPDACVTFISESVAFLISTVSKSDLKLLNSV